MFKPQKFQLVLLSTDSVLAPLMDDGGNCRLTKLLTTNRNNSVFPYPGTQLSKFGTFELFYLTSRSLTWPPAGHTATGFDFSDESFFSTLSKMLASCGIKLTKVDRFSSSARATFLNWWVATHFRVLELF